MEYTKETLFLQEKEKATENQQNYIANQENYAHSFLF